MKRVPRQPVRRWRAGDLQFAAADDDPGTLHRLLPTLTPAERALRHRLRVRHLIGRALLRELLLRATGSGRRRIRFLRNRRPLDRSPDRRRFALSVTHGEGCVVAVIAPGASAGRRIGVDLEPRGRELSPRLRRRIGGGIARWLHLEAVLKCDGRGVPALERALTGFGAGPGPDPVAEAGTGSLGAYRLADRPARRIVVTDVSAPRRGRYRLAVARSRR